MNSIEYIKDMEEKLEKQTTELEAVKKQLNQIKAERKQCEEALKQVQNEIETRNNEPANKLEEINKQLNIELDEHRMIAEALHESEYQFRTLVDNIPGAIYRCKVDKKWTMEYFSDAIQEISGYPAHDFIENRVRSYRSIIHPDDIDKYEETIIKGMDPLHSYFIEYRIYNAEGKIRWFIEKGQCVYSPEGDPLWLDGAIFDESERKFAEEALQRANAALQRQATLDGLTQIANRRRFDEYLGQEWKRMKREQYMLSMIMCDIDYFKLYNDGYGHQQGDKCLKRVAKLIDSALKRPADFVARYGGEEFAVILPNTDAKGALHIAELIRDEIVKSKILHEYTKVNQCVTLSLGVSTTAPDQLLSKETLIQNADMALYKAKEQGRNQVIYFNELEKNGSFQNSVS